MEEGELRSQVDPMELDRVDTGTLPHSAVHLQVSESTENVTLPPPRTPQRPSRSLSHLGPVQETYGSILHTTPYPFSPFTHPITPYPSFSPYQPPYAPPAHALLGTGSPLARQSTSTSSGVDRLEALRDQSSPSARPRDTHAMSGIKATVAARFATGLFMDVKLDKVMPHQPHLWYNHTTDEERILVVLRAIEAAGFSLPQFLVTLFRPGFNQHPTVYHRVASFLRARSLSNPSPLDLVKAIYEHPKSRGAQDPPQFPSLPRHAWPPQERYLPARLPLGTSQQPAQELLLDFALQLVLRQVDKEADELLSPEHGLVYSRQALSWSVLRSFSVTSKQELFTQYAPALFAIMSTVAVNRELRKKIENRALDGDQPASLDEPDTGVDIEALPTEDLREANAKVPATPRDPWLAVTVMIMMLLVFRYRRAIMFPLCIGILLFTCNAHRDIFRTLGRFGLCVAYSTTLDKLSLLAESQSHIIAEWSRRFQEDSVYFQLVYDNVNKRRTIWQKTIAQQDEMQSGTAATIIKLEDVPPNAMSLDLLEKHARDHPRSTLTYDELREDVDWEHLSGVGAGTVLRVWLQWIPALSRHHEQVENLFRQRYKKHRLPVRKSEIRTLRCSGIDESTTEGSNRVLNDLINQLHLPTECLASRILLVCGDQLTIDRIRKLKLYFRKMKTPTEQRAWARPIIQLWHMKWAWQKAIIKLNWFNATEVLTFGLHFDCFRLERRKFNPTKGDFHQSHHLLRDVFETQVLDALRLLCEEETKVAYPETTRLVEGLTKYFDKNGPLADCSFDRLLELANVVYDRYMCLAAYEDTLGHTARDEALYGPSLNLVPDTAAKPSSDLGLSDDDKVPPVDDPKTWHGDRLLANTTNFMRQTLWYIEFCAAVSEGDIGRVFEIIKVLRFSFWGAGSTNYGNELLELACNFMREYPPELRTALLNNYLVNPSGLPGHWHEIDLLQEHHNFWLKRLYQSKTLSFESKFLKNAIGLNLCGFNDFRDNFSKSLGLRSSSGFHPDKKRIDDINRLGAHYREQHVLQFIEGRTQAYKVRNEFEAGAEKLQTTQLASFLQRTSESGYHGFAETEDETDSVTNGLDSLESNDVPANPIITSNGVSNIAEFVDSM